VTIAGLARRTRLRREADDLIETVSLVAAHQRGLVTGVAEDCRRLNRLAGAAEVRARELASRLERVERGLSHLQDALPRRKARIATLREQIGRLRSDPDVGRAPERQVDDSERIGAALIYAGCLVLVWLVLWQLGLAFGLR
jgi:chromosome segregation ATPase